MTCVVSVLVGYSRKYTNGTSLGYRAVRWDASATAATEPRLACTGSRGSRAIRGATRSDTELQENHTLVTVGSMLQTLFEAALRRLHS